ncbi:MAG: RecQ family zinc-binding domain-containing protein, partial [Flavobacteriales bacterium]|nr:RecQ family zinc-binding domain-containing protein [Flavobacteriales bacterium]
KIHLKLEHSELNKFQISNKYFDPYIKLLLRSYSGLFEDYVNINETLLAGRSKTNKNKIIKVLKKMQELEILDYLPKKQGTQIIYLQNRVDEKYLHLSEEKQKKNKDSEIKRMNFILNYCNQNSTCRTEILLSYFGEHQKFRCGKCDICRQRNKLEISDLKFNKIKKKVFIILSEESKTLIEICDLIKDFREEKIIKVINFLIENSELISEGNKIRKQT